MQQNTPESSNIRSVLTTYGADFSAFDQLPFSVRRAMANAPYDISSEDVLKAYWKARNDFFSPMSDYEFARDFERNMRCQVQVASYSKTERYGEYEFRYANSGAAGKAESRYHKQARARSAAARVHERRTSRQRNIFG